MLEPELVDAAAERFEELWTELTEGPLLERLAQLDPSVVRRELPVLLPSDATEPAQPAGGYAGTLDLLYRDGNDWVVADYKSDRVCTDEEIARAAESHAPQISRYADAVQQALGLERPVRRELWFLQAGRVVEVPSD